MGYIGDTQGPLVITLYDILCHGTPEPSTAPPGPIDTNAAYKLKGRDVFYVCRYVLYGIYIYIDI